MDYKQPAWFTSIAGPQALQYVTLGSSELHLPAAQSKEDELVIEGSRNKVTLETQYIDTSLGCGAHGLLSRPTGWKKKGLITRELCGGSRRTSATGEATEELSRY